MPPLPSLNYHHLQYFWLIAKEGSLTAAAKKLRLAPPTLSAQLHTLEEQLGERLFHKRGRGLALTEMGRVVLGYADDIFTRGAELLDAVHGRADASRPRLLVGVADAVPKRIARRVLEPVRHLEDPVRMVIQEDKPERLLAALAVHELDVVIADGPPGHGVSVRAYGHLLGECGVGFFATRALAQKHRPNFPRSLDGAPLLLPIEGSGLRRGLEHFFANHGLRPRIVAEIEDSALLEAFGVDGAALFPASLPLARELARKHKLELVGEADAVRERFYAITVERRIRHPAVAAIWQTARRDMFH